MASLAASLSPTIRNQDTHYMIIFIIIEMVTKGDLVNGWWIVRMMDDGLHDHRHHREGDLADGWWGVDGG